ncbi:hypothetical protein UFOVP36_53 [uncultured Caudovirales phage]|uniref:Uncharacterized protein n=1 Tax=uncultured Caudovirales phage TaxID=2100421 RepID=A0A6J5KMR4_9CAUD|nr:hypothetical protein UFOVP36_53 [uncultured Caudovirales phage]
MTYTPRPPRFPIIPALAFFAVAGLAGYFVLTFIRFAFSI